MSLKQHSKVVILCGSAGSIPSIIKIVESLPLLFAIPVVIIIHRQRNVSSDMAKILSMANDKKIVEPNDKEVIQQKHIYLAPQNYHLLIEEDKTFGLDYSELVHYSRPSFDVTLESAARIFKDNVIAVLLSGANNDGTAGLQHVLANKGIAIVQDPASAEYPAMPLSAINTCKGVQVMKPDVIISFINALAKNT